MMNGSEALKQPGGSAEIGIGLGEGEQKNRIVLTLGATPINWFSMDPQNAVDIAKDLIDKAVMLGFDVQIVLPKREMSKVKRTMLVNRVSLVMRNLLEKKRDANFIAEELVTIVLRDAE